MPQILGDQFARSTQALNGRDAAEGGFEMGFKARLLADLPERTLHRDRVGSDHGSRVDGEDVDVIVALDEIGSGHDLTCFMQQNLRQNVTAFGVVGFIHRLLSLHQGLGQNHRRRLNVRQGK